VVASDKLFYWLFQQRAERLQPLVASLLPQMEGFVFSAPVLKEREYRLDGLFLPPADQPELPALILEAQMGPDPEFLLRLNAETGCLLQQQQRQGRPIRQWQVVVICPSRQLNFGDPTEAASTSLGTEIDDVIAAILVSRFSGRTVPEICAMGGITVEDFSSSVAYREIFGLGRQEGRQAEAAALTLRLLQRRCGSLNPNQEARIQSLPLSALESLADALLDFQGPEDLKAWLSGHAT